MTQIHFCHTWWLFSPKEKLLGKISQFFPCLCFFKFFQWISARAHYFHSLSQGQSTVAPWIGELQPKKLWSHLLRTQNPKVLPLKPGVGQYIAMDSTLTDRDFFLANVLPQSIHLHFSKTSLNFSMCKLWLTPLPVWFCKVKQVALLVFADD